MRFVLNSNLRRLFVNLSFRSTANLVTKLIGLIVFPILARALEPTGYGYLAFILLIVQYTSIPLGLMGFRTHSIRAIARDEHEEDIMHQVLSHSVSVVLPSIVVSLVICAILFHDNLPLLGAIAIAFIMVITQATDIEFYFAARKDLVTPTTCKFIGQLVYVVGVILFIRRPEHLIFAVLLLSLSQVVANILQVLRFRRIHERIRLQLSLVKAIQYARNSYKLGIANNLEVLFPSIAPLILSLFTSAYHLGIYSAGYKVFTILLVFYTTIFYALAPYIVKLHTYAPRRKGKYILGLFLLFSAFGCGTGLVLFFVGPWLIPPLLGPSFFPAVGLFKVISITLVPLWPIFMLAGSLLVYFGIEKYYLNSLFVGFAVSGLLSILLVPNFYSDGALIAFAVSLFCSVLYCIISLYRADTALKAFFSGREPLDASI